MEARSPPAAPLCLNATRHDFTVLAAAMSVLETPATMAGSTMPAVAPPIDKVRLDALKALFVPLLVRLNAWRGAPAPLAGLCAQ